MRPAILILTLFLSVDGFLFGWQNTRNIGDQVASVFRESRGMSRPPVVRTPPRVSRAAAHLARWALARRSNRADPSPQGEELAHDSRKSARFSGSGASQQFKARSCRAIRPANSRP